MHGHVADTNLDAALLDKGTSVHDETQNPLRKTFELQDPQELIKDISEFQEYNVHIGNLNVYFNY